MHWCPTTRTRARPLGHNGSSVSTEDIGVWPADDGELVVSVRGGGTVVSNQKKVPGRHK